MSLYQQYPLPAIVTKDDLLVVLKFLHALITATEGLLKAARMPLDNERGHALWLAEDIRLLGDEPPQCDHEAAAIAGAQYYYIYHVDRRMLLGYRMALEGNPTPLEVIDQLEARFGPLACLRHHAEHDPLHRLETQAQIEAIDDPWLRQQIEFNQNRTIVAISGVLNARVSWMRLMQQPATA